MPQTKVFISYRRDGGEAIAQLIHDRLSKVNDFSIFYDIVSLDAPSENYKEVIRKAIEEIDVFIWILTKDCLVKRKEDDIFWDEITQAVDLKKKIIPVYTRSFSMIPPAFEQAHPGFEKLRYAQAINLPNMEHLDADIAKLERYCRISKDMHHKKTFTRSPAIHNSGLHSFITNLVGKQHDKKQTPSPKKKGSDRSASKHAETVISNPEVYVLPAVVDPFPHKKWPEMDHDTALHLCVIFDILNKNTLRPKLPLYRIDDPPVISSAERSRIQQQAMHGDALAKFREDLDPTVANLIFSSEERSRIRQQAMHDKVQAQYLEGLCLLYGPDKHPEEAYALLQKAASKGHAPAQFEMGIHYWDTDRQTAMEYLRKASKQNNFQALLFLAQQDPAEKANLSRHYFRPSFDPFKNDDPYYRETEKRKSSAGAECLCLQARELMNSLANKDKDSAIHAFRIGIDFYQEAAISFGYIPAMKELAYILLQCEASRKDRNYKAVRTLLEAAISYSPEEADPDSLFHLGWCYQEGFQDICTAYRFYERAAAKGHMYAAYWLGKFWSSDYNPKKDYAAAVSYFEKSTQAGCVWAMFSLSNLYSNGLGCVAQPEKGRHLLEHAKANDLPAPLRPATDAFFKVIRTDDFFKIGQEI